MKHLSFVLLLSSVAITAGAQYSGAEKKAFDAFRTQNRITVNGELDEEIWQSAAVAAGFIQAFPIPGAPPTYETEVRVLYDDNAIYIGATLYDAHPDSILRELTQRDQIGNTDWFGVFIDTYRDGNNGLMFIVTASGIQFDAKITPNNSDNWNVVPGEDVNWDAVWDAEARITDKGWVAEMRIPYSALRFPKTQEQLWQVNFARGFKRMQQRSYWSEVDPLESGFLNQGGHLKNIRDVRSPIRLQANPYLAGYGEWYHDKNGNPKDSYGRSINGGMDIKYGINDAFTLDMTLIPDFGEAQSDNQVLNLSPFEVQFNENRQFFMEGTELFNKGGWFYSRRIGGQPLHYWDVSNQMREGEFIVDNPQQSQLYNATKISGRTGKGLGIGFFNATSGETNARVRDSEGIERDIMTNPLTNYNVLVLDQNLKHNSFVTLVNTTVLRAGSDYDANLTGTVFTLRNKTNKYQLTGKAVLSQQYASDETTLGHNYNLFASKISGNFQWSAGYYEESDTYNPNDLGFIYSNNERAVEGSLNYNKYEPFSIFNNANGGVYVNYARLYHPNVFTSASINFWASAQTKDFWNWNIWTYHEPFINYDYFEPRTPGRYFKAPTNNNYGFWVGSDSRKRMRISFETNFRKYGASGRHRWNWTFTPRYRVNDKLNFTLQVGNYNFINDMGFATNTTFNETDPVTGEPTSRPAIIFGRRDQITVENIFNTNYTFNNKMTLSFRLRHYWTKVDYNRYYELEEDGDLASTDYAGQHNANFDAFNIDVVYRWRFAPGSDLFLIWKNAISSYDSFANLNYFNNLDGLLEAPQLNSLSLKVIYFLDYASLVHR
jgi:hypothetical protein